MATIVLDQVRLELTAEQIIAAFRQLPPAEQERVRHALTPEEWESQFRALLARIGTRLEAQPISDEEIDEEVRLARQARRAAQGSH